VPAATPTAAPALDVDLYADDVLADPAEVYRRIRGAGPAVWLPRHRMFAIGGYEDVRAALRDDAGFRSGHGVAANPVANALGGDTTLNSDDEDHARRRRVLMRSLGAKALGSIEEPLRREAQAVVDELLRRDHFDAVADFASRLPLAVVAQLVGVPGGGERMLRWAAATFDGLGPLNARGLRRTPRALGLVRYARSLTPGSVARDSWASSVFDAHARGELTLDEARALVIDFVAPSLDTTILAAAHLLQLLGAHPDAWDELRADPSLVAAAVMETVRLASPIRGFTRVVERDQEVSGTVLPAGSRVVLLYAAANRDERRFEDPDAFDLHRPSHAHLGWGNGPHACVGMHLAKLELRLLVEAMLPRVDRVVTGTATPLRNNTLQGVARLPARFL
jgi:cytochrome P450